MRLPNLKSSSAIVFTCLLASLASLVYSTNIHSDILFMKYLLDDISSGGSWSHWRFSPAPSYFPDLLIYFLAYSVTKLAPVQIILTTSAQAIIIALLSITLLKRLNPAISQSARLAVIGFTLLCVITTSQYTIESIIGIFFGSNNIQVPTLISSLALLVLALTINEKKTTIKAVVFILIGALGFASSAAFIMCFTLPFLATLSILAARSKLDGNDQNLKSYVLIFLLFVASQIVGYLLSNTITFNSPLDDRFSFSFEGARFSFFQFLNATKFLFDPSTLTAFATASVFLMTFFYALLKVRHLPLELLKKTRTSAVASQEQLVNLFFLLTTASSFFGAILSGGFKDKFGYRYFETFIALSAIITIYFIEKSLSERAKTYTKTCLVVFSTLATACSIIALEHNRYQSFSDLLRDGAFKDQEQSTARCLDNLIEKGVPLKAGIADYWMSRGVMFYMKNNIFIGQYTDQLHPFFWISSLGYMKHPEKYNTFFYNFVIAQNGPRGRRMGFDSDSLKQKVPPDYQVLTCTNSTSEVFYYPGKALDSRLKENQEKFLLPILGRGTASFSGSELPGLIGHVDGSYRSTSVNDPSGVLSYGPYISLPRGKYKAILEFDAVNEGSAVSNRIEIGRFEGKSRTILYSGDLQPGEHSLIMDLNVGNKVLDKIEAQIIFNGTGKLTIKRLKFVGE